MRKFAKGLFIFTGGVIVGGVYITGKFLSSKEVAEALAHKLSDKVINFVYGDYDPKRGVEPEEVRFTNLDTADKVLKDMQEIIDKYGYVTIADYLDLCELPSKFTDNKFGWMDLKGTTIEVHPHSYVIKFPRVYEVK